MEGAAHRALGLGVLLQTTVMAFTIHQHKPGGIPELVAEIAVALTTLAVEIDAAAQGRQRRESESQRIGAISGDALGEFFLGVFTHLRRRLGLAQTLAALLEQGL